MFNQVITSLTKGSIFPTLKILAKYEAEMIKEQVNAKNDISFFISFVQKCENSEEKIEFYQFCCDLGYDIKNSSSYYYDKLVPDYYLAMQTGSDIFATSLTKEVGAEYVVEIAKKFALLPTAYSYNLQNTIKILVDNGLSHDTFYKTHRPILDIINSKSENKELLESYWKNQTTTLEQDLVFIDKSIKNIYQRNSPNEVKIIVDYLKERLPKLNEKQQEEVILHLLPTEDSRLFSQGLKILGKNMATYKPKFFPLWNELDKINNPQILYDIMGQDTDFTTEYEGEKYIVKLMSHLGSQGFFLGEVESYYSAKERAKHEKLKSLLKIDHSFWYSHVPGASHTWFNEFMQSKSIYASKLCILNPYSAKIFAQEYAGKTKFYNPKNNFDITLKGENCSEKTGFSESYQKVYREMLDVTWFNKDKNGIYAVEHLLKNHTFYFEWAELFSGINFQIEKITPIFSVEEKERLLTAIVNANSKQICNDYSVTNKIRRFPQLFNNMKEDKNICWTNIVINKKVWEEIKHTEFGFELRALQMNADLHNKLKNKQTAVKRCKI